MWRICGGIWRRGWFEKQVLTVHFFGMIKKAVINLLDYFRFKRSYSQDGEDVVLDSFFEGQKNYKGFYVDIGAHHPVRFSNTMAFYRKGWHGINIDATPGSMLPFKWLRRRDINLELGIGKEKGNLSFYCFNEPALNTFDHKLAEERNTGKPYRINKIIEVSVLPLSDILEEYFPNGKHIDFFSIDVEGMDLIVLESNNWELFKPTYILIEDLDASNNDFERSKIFNYLNKQGYFLIAKLKRTLIYST